MGCPSSSLRKPVPSSGLQKPAHRKPLPQRHTGCAHVTDEHFLHARTKRGLSDCGNQSATEHPDLVLDQCARPVVRPSRQACGRGRRTAPVPDLAARGVTHALPVDGVFRLAYLENRLRSCVADGACSGLLQGVAAEVVHDGDLLTGAVRSLPRIQNSSLWIKAEEFGGLP